MTTVGLEEGTVTVHPYSVEWPRLFEAEKLQLRACLGDFVLDIQHIGSTSVPGLPAKPILDIGVAVVDFDEAFRCIPLLEQLGYVYQGELGIPRRHYFVKGRPRTHHLHMNEIQSADWQRTIAFRDALRKRPDSVQAYASLKQELAQQYPHDVTAYTAGKSGFIEQVLREAGVGSADDVSA